MNFSYGDDHDEDDLPVISIPKITHQVRQNQNQSYERNHTEDDYLTRLIGNWQNLYETSVQSLYSDDEDQRSTTQQPFYIDRQTPAAQPQREIHPSPSIYHSELEANLSKSKWQIRLPELLSGTVGPDRQKRNLTRRHTTSVVFQVKNPHNSELNEPHTSMIGDDRPRSPMVQQLKQKFDRMSSTENLSMGISSNHPQPSFSNQQGIRRVASIAGRPLTSNITEHINRTPRSFLPIRPSAELTISKPRTASVGAASNRSVTTNGRASRERMNPPVSYPKYFYPPPSTTAVVKQLIGGGATLVYDSISSSTSTSPRNSPRLKHQRSIDKRIEDISNSNVLLTGRQLVSDSSSETYATIKPRIYDKPTPKKSNEDDPENIYCEPISRETSANSSPSPSPRISTNTTWNQRKYVDEDEPENYYPVYDTNK
ncbi:unnamed protein product [Adineta ricciae]|uniref:Uncharacterized protein n=1 Tax=Adineta ricciae TaxID=249248 RepID=A0A814G1H4_ADIRI|nr:unnamed protein product [Adineta ricciae]CAF1440130.1 unnamed protein product [Adineta ricciae]